MNTLPFVYSVLAAMVVWALVGTLVWLHEEYQETFEGIAFILAMVLFFLFTIFAFFSLFFHP